MSNLISLALFTINVLLFLALSLWAAEPVFIKVHESLFVLVLVGIVFFSLGFSKNRKFLYKYYFSKKLDQYCFLACLSLLMYARILHNSKPLFENPKFLDLFMIFCFVGLMIPIIRILPSPSEEEYMNRFKK